MRIANARDLGHYVRDRRRQLGKSQAELATAAQVSRRWLADLEAGKPTVAVGLVFQTLGALGLVLDAQTAKRGRGQIDLDEHLRGFVSGSDESM